MGNFVNWGDIFVKKHNICHKTSPFIFLLIFFVTKKGLSGRFLIWQQELIESYK